MNQYEIAKDIPYFVAHAVNVSSAARSESFTLTTSTRYDSVIWCLPEIVIHIIISVQLQLRVVLCEVYTEYLKCSFGEK